ncbi:hypothetical protein AB1Y20_005957 [Prymnesium parvum]|uniref:WW domain-containing protein n=1 Tax=Prymnesium parvum TaxID=97485 RepID=A0AB34J0B6_PRYPA
MWPPPRASPPHAPTPPALPVTPAAAVAAAPAVPVSGRGRTMCNTPAWMVREEAAAAAGAEPCDGVAPAAAGAEGGAPQGRAAPREAMAPHGMEWMAPHGAIPPHGMMMPHGMIPTHELSHGMIPPHGMPHGMAPHGMMPHWMMPPQGVQPNGMTPYGMTPYGMTPYGMAAPQGMPAQDYGLQHHQGMPPHGMPREMTRPEGMPPYGYAVPPHQGVPQQGMPPPHGVAAHAVAPQEAAPHELMASHEALPPQAVHEVPREVAPSDVPSKTTAHETSAPAASLAEAGAGGSGEAERVLERMKEKAKGAKEELQARDEDAPKEMLEEWPMGPASPAQRGAEKEALEKAEGRDNVAEAEVPSAAEALLAEVGAKPLRRPGEVLDEVLEALRKRIRSVHGRVTSVAFTTALGVPDEGEREASEEDPLTIRVAGAHCQQALPRSEEIKASRSLLRSGRPSVLIRDAGFIHTHFGDAAKRRLGTSCSAVLCASVCDPPSRPAAILGVIEVLCAAGALSPLVEEEVVRVAAGVGDLLARAHTRFDAARRKILSAPAPPSPSVTAAIEGGRAAAAAAAAALSERLLATARREWFERQMRLECERWALPFARLRQEFLHIEPTQRRVLGKAVEYRLRHGLHFEAKLRQRHGAEREYSFLVGGSNGGVYHAIVRGGAELWRRLDVEANAATVSYPREAEGGSGGGGGEEERREAKGEGEGCERPRPSSPLEAQLQVALDDALGGDLPQSAAEGSTPQVSGESAKAEAEDGSLSAKQISEGWTRVCQPGEHPYYWHAPSGEVRWTPPSEAPPPPEPSPPAVLPDGWRFVTDSGEHPYYWHPQSGEVRWELPAHPSDAAAAARTPPPPHPTGGPPPLPPGMTPSVPPAAPAEGPFAKRPRVGGEWGAAPGMPGAPLRPPAPQHAAPVTPADQMLMEQTADFILRNGDRVVSMLLQNQKLAFLQPTHPHNIHFRMIVDHLRRLGAVRK